MGKDGIMDETLKPLIATGSECVPMDDLYVVAEEDEEPWKLIFLAFIVIKFMWIMSGVIHQRILLNDEQGLHEKYNKLSDKVKALFPLDKLKDARAYNKGYNNLDLIWFSANFVFDFLVILFDIPALIWYFWLDVLQNDGHCGIEADV